MAAIGLHRGKYQVRIRRVGSPSISRTFSRKKDAEAWAVVTEQKMEKGDYEPDGALRFTTLGELLECYSKEVTPTKRSQEIEGMRIEKMKRSWISEIRLLNLRPHHIAKYRDERLLTIQGNAVARDLSLISHAIDTAIKEWNYPLKRNPVSAVRKPTSNRSRNRRLELGEEQPLLNAVNHSQNIWLAPLVEIAIETAMRRGELLSIEWSDVDLDRRTIHLENTKNGSPRTVPLSRRALEILNTIPRDISGRVFPVSAAALRGLWRRACKRANIDNLHFHDLRHEATSRFFEKGLNVMEVAAITGHKDLRMLQRYTHLRAEDLAKKLG